MPVRPVAVATCAVALSALVGLRAQTSPPAAPTGGRLHTVHVTTADVFDAVTIEDHLVPRLINLLHATTRREVIERECWLQPGQQVTAVQAAELERSLRRLGLFAEVTVRLVPIEPTGDVDLEIRTRDRMSLFFGGGGTYVGGVSGFNVAVGDNNLLGTGDSLEATFRRNSQGDSRGQISYRELHLLDSWVSGRIQLQRTDDGDGAALQLDRPFKHLADPLAWNAGVSTLESAATYYRLGDNVAEVPTRRAALGGELLWGSGPEDARDARGFVLTADQRSYGVARGPLGPGLRVPGDTARLYCGVRATGNRIDGYRKVTGFDTIDYVQDLTLGTSLRLDAGVRLRDEAGQGLAPQPELGLGGNWATEALPDLFANLGFSTSSRWYAGTVQAWSVAGRAQTFWAPTERQTLATSATFDAVEELQDLLPQLTLGEDNGLRGYRARELAGTRRLRLNLEHRLDSSLEVWTFRLGLVAFADAGWVGDGGNLGRPFRSAGVGLRIGSVPLLGSGILRIDAAHPFDESFPGSATNWSFSVALGQVFTFGGNASVL